MIKIIAFMLLFMCAFAQLNNNQQIRGNNMLFNSHRTTFDSVKPQSIGGGFQSRGGHVKMHETYHPPQSIGGGFQSSGGWAKVPDKPYVGPVAQFIIDTATITAGGHKSDK